MIVKDIGGDEFWDLCRRSKRKEIHITMIARGKNNGDWTVTYTDWAERKKQMELELQRKEEQTTW
jgi:hypothetical protein